MTIRPLGDMAVIATLGDGVDEQTLGRVRALAAALRAAQAPGIVDVVPAYASVTVFYEPARFAGTGARPFPTIAQLIEWCAARIVQAEEGPAERRSERVVEIPVLYGGPAGPDLPEVARKAGLEPGEAAARHAAGSYRVHAVGFLPGFAYLGGLPPLLHFPRLATPRRLVPAGSVGIGGAQTGVYPLASPGGWRLIGRTPMRLFNPGDEQPGLLCTGDVVRFRSISMEEFDAWS